MNMIIYFTYLISKCKSYECFVSLWMVLIAFEMSSRDFRSQGRKLRSPSILIDFEMSFRNFRTQGRKRRSPLISFQGGDPPRPPPPGNKINHINLVQIKGIPHQKFHQKSHLFSPISSSLFRFKLINLFVYPIYGTRWPTSKTCSRHRGLFSIWI